MSRTLSLDRSLALGMTRSFSTQFFAYTRLGINLALKGNAVGLHVKSLWAILAGPQETGLGPLLISIESWLVSTQ